MAVAGKTTVVEFALTSGTTFSGTLTIDGYVPTNRHIEYNVQTELAHAEHEPQVKSDGTWHIENATPGRGELIVYGVSEDGQKYERNIALELAPSEQRVMDIDLAAEDVTDVGSPP